MSCGVGRRRGSKKSKNLLKLTQEERADLNITIKKLNVCVQLD